MDFKTMSIDDIITWCKANNQTAWLKDFCNTKVECKVYPRVEKDGKKVADKTAAPTIQMRKPTFIQIKTAFAQKFMPEIAPKAKEKKPSMYDRIAAL